MSVEGKFKSITHIFYAFNNVERPVQTPAPTTNVPVQQLCRGHIEANVETV